MDNTKLKFIPHMNTKLCCCFSSKTGCLIIGYSGIIVILLYFAVVLLSGFSYNSGFLFSWAVLYAHYLLIQGVNEQEPRKMYLWIYLNYIALIIRAILTVLCFILLLVLPILEEPVTDVSLVIVFCCILTITTGLGYHFFAAVVTHCQDLILIQSSQQILTP